MEDVYKSINRITRNEARTKAYQELSYDSISEVLTEGIHEVSYNKGKRYSYDKSHNSSTFRKQHSNSPHHRYQSRTQSYQTSTKMQCHYCEGEHSINVCKTFKKDKDKYSLIRAEITKKFWERLLKNTRKSNMTSNKAALSSRPQELTYSVEEAKQLIGRV